MTPTRQLGRVAAALGIALTCAAAPCQDPAEEVLRGLRAGNQRFAAGERTKHPRGEATRRTLARAQRPRAVVVTCSDSRVPPELVFDTGLGELYTLRVAGNACTAEMLAGVELAVERLGVRLCVVLAHEDCAAVRDCAARLESSDAAQPVSDPAYQDLLDRIEPAVRVSARTGWAGRDLLARAEEENAQRTLQVMLRRSPLLRERRSSGHLRLLAARYRQDTGLVEWLPERPYAGPASEDSRPPARTPSVPTGAPPHMALRMLQAGHRRFVSAGALAGDVSPDRRASLQHGRQPFAVVVTCADSRVVPELLFDTGLGDLHVLRVPGTVWTPEVLASIDQAVRDTGVSLCVVLAHRGCDDLAAAADPDPEYRRSESMRLLAERLEPALERARTGGGGALLDRAAAQSALRLVRRLREESPLLRGLQDEGRFDAAAALYDPATGAIEWLREDAQAPPAPGPETDSGTDSKPPEPDHTAADGSRPRPAPPEPDEPEDVAVDLPPDSKVTGHRIRNHDLAMLITLMGMLTVLGTGLLIWQRQSG